jgi:hypothetical protein
MWTELAQDRVNSKLCYWQIGLRILSRDKNYANYTGHAWERIKYGERFETSIPVDAGQLNSLDVKIY